MPNPVIYDDAAYHSGARVFSTRKVSPQNAGTHMGMYLAWIIQKRLESFHLRRDAADPVEAVRGKQMTGRDLLFSHCDGRLTSDALNKEAQAFTDFYYEAYLRDYEELLAQSAGGSYNVIDSWANLERISIVMDRKLDEYRLAQSPVKPAAS